MAEYARGGERTADVAEQTTAELLVQVLNVEAARASPNGG
jgi:hypothetical protein